MQQERQRILNCLSIIVRLFYSTYTRHDVNITWVALLYCWSHSIKCESYFKFSQANTSLIHKYY